MTTSLLKRVHGNASVQSQGPQELNVHHGTVHRHQRTMASADIGARSEPHRVRFGNSARGRRNSYAKVWHCSETKG